MDMKAIVFDFGGVLMDWNPRYLFRKFFPGDPGAVERFLIEVNFNEWNLELDKGVPFAERIAQLTKQFPGYRAILQAYDECWEETLAGPIQPTVDILCDLKEAGYPLYGLSNWSAEKFNLVRGKHDFFNWFRYIVLSGEVRQVKPEPEIFQTVLKTIQCKAEDCLFIDDSLPNITAARMLGFDTIHFQSPDQLRSALNQKGIKF